MLILVLLIDVFGPRKQVRVLALEPHLIILLLPLKLGNTCILHQLLLVPKVYVILVQPTIEVPEEAPDLIC